MHIPSERRVIIGVVHLDEVKTKKNVRESKAI